MSFDDAVSRFLQVVGANMKAYHQEHRHALSWSDKPFDPASHASPPVVVGGRKYLKVATISGGQRYVQRMVYCFIERETGRILKAEGWKKPSLLDRGASIYDEDSYKHADPFGSWLYK